MEMQITIESKLEEAFKPSHLQVLNESHRHSVPPNSETHFKVVLVSSLFDGKRSVARHQQIYKVLVEELAGSVHALALHTFTEDEWQKENGAFPDSPACHGSSKRD